MKRTSLIEYKYLTYLTYLRKEYLKEYPKNTCMRCWYFKIFLNLQLTSDILYMQYINCTSIIKR